MNDETIITENNLFPQGQIHESKSQKFESPIKVEKENLNKLFIKLNSCKLITSPTKQQLPRPSNLDFKSIDVMNAEEILNDQNPLLLDVNNSLDKNDDQPLQTNEISSVLNNCKKFNALNVSIKGKTVNPKQKSRSSSTVTKSATMTKKPSCAATTTTKASILTKTTVSFSKAKVSKNSTTIPNLKKDLAPKSSRPSSLPKKQLTVKGFTLEDDFDYKNILIELKNVFGHNYENFNEECIYH